jgi:hypothetical protein
MKKEEVLKLVETKPEADFVVRTAEEEKTFLENYAEQVKEEKLGKIFNDLDSEVFNISGQKRQTADENGNPLPLNKREKTFDFIKRVLGSYKTDAEKAKDFEGKIKTLEQQLRDNAGDKKLLADLESMQKAYKQLEDESKSKIQDLEGKHKRKEAEAMIRAALPTNFRKNLPESVIKTFVKENVDALLAEAQVQDDKLVFVDKDGAVRRNPHNALQPYTASELLNERLKDIIETGRKTEGGPGLGKEITYEKDNKGNVTKVNVYVPESVRSKEELSKFLVSAGLLRGTKEYTLAYAEYSKSLPFSTN